MKKWEYITSKSVGNTSKNTLVSRSRTQPGVVVVGKTLALARI